MTTIERVLTFLASFGAAILLWGVCIVTGPQ